MLSLLLELVFKTQGYADDVEHDESYGRCPSWINSGDLIYLLIYTTIH